MNSAADAALKKFELDEVLVSRPILYDHTFLSEYNLDRDPIDYYWFYVLGVKDGEEIFILAPRYQKDELIQIDWPLQHSFTECIAALNEFLSCKERMSGSLFGKLCEYELSAQQGTIDELIQVLQKAICYE